MGSGLMFACLHLPDWAQFHQMKPIIIKVGACPGLGPQIGVVFSFSTHFHSRIKSINPPPTPSNLSTSSSLIRISPRDSNGASVNKNDS